MEAVTGSDEASIAATTSEDSLTIDQEDASTGSGRYAKTTPSTQLVPRRIRIRTRKRLKASGVENYRKLLNSEIEDVVNHPLVGNDSVPLPPSQLGASFWTSDEKRILFNALPRLGRHNLRRLAAAVATKSESEVHQYLLLLQQGVRQKHLLESKQQLAASTEIAAALELGPECCKAMEEAADALAATQWFFESTEEREKYAHLWLLDRRVAEVVEARLDEEQRAEDEQDAEREKCGREGVAPTENVEGVEADVSADIPPFLRCFDLSSWLELSELIFMNPAAPRLDENWRTFAADEDERPSIMYTALSDFYNLTVSLTKRLVQASLFIATSRLRARPSKPSVTMEDVATALKVLGMSGDRQGYWIKIPRRFNLDVYPSAKVYRYRDIVSANKLGQKFSHDKLEELLTSSSVAASRRRSNGQPHMDEIRAAPSLDFKHESKSVEGVQGGGNGMLAEGSHSLTTEHRLADYESDYSSISETLVNFASAMNPSDSDFDIYNNTASKRKRYKMQHEAKEEEYAEAFDRQASWSEEQRSWALLGREPPSQIKSEESEPPKKPVTHRKGAVELEDWITRTERESEWETYGEVVTGKSIHRSKG